MLVVRPHPSLRGPRALLKRAVDIGGSAALLAVGGPILAVAAVAIRLEGDGPVMFSQERAGLHGKPFRLYKLRTMRPATDAEGKPLPDDQRLTPLGKLLRASSVDELPQLFNVVRGDMSLVGPRPLYLKYVPLYSAAQAHRLDVRPGLTGWAQIRGRNSVSWDEKLAMDAWYVDHFGIRLDLRILAGTVGRVLRMDGISSAGHATMPEFTGSEPRAIK